MAAAEVTAATSTKVSATSAAEMATAAETAAASEVPTTPETTAAHAPRLSVRPAQRQEQRRPRRKNVFNVH
jgi:hypothetical protein